MMIMDNAVEQKVSLDCQRSPFLLSPYLSWPFLFNKTFGRAPIDIAYYLNDCHQLISDQELHDQ